MYTYFDTVPAAAAKPMFDGHLYAHSDKKMHQRADGKTTVCEGAQPRLMRVGEIKNGVAFVPLGKAGDAIACTVGLPFAVQVRHTADGVGA